MTIVEFKRVHHWARRNSRIIWPIGEEEYHACLSRTRTPVQVWYGSPYRGECSKEARRSPKPLGWVRFPTVPAICASNSVGRVAAFGEVIQLEENANASSNLAFSTISRLSGVRVTSGAPKYAPVVELADTLD